MLALKGDSIDNIPGAPGIGDKGARDIIALFGSVEAALDRAAEVERKMYRESLQNNRAQIELSKKLATIHTDIPIEWDLHCLARASGESIRAQADLQGTGIFQSAERSSARKTIAPHAITPYWTAPTELQAWLAKRPGDAPLAVALDLTNSFIGLSYKAGVGRAVPLSLLEAMRPVLESASVPKVVHDAKAFLIDLDKLGVKHPQGIDEDVMLLCVPLERRSGRLFARSASRTFSRSQAERRGGTAGRGDAGRRGIAAPAD